MIAKTLALFALVATASAGVVFNSLAPHHTVDDLGSVGAQAEHTVRGYNGFGGLQTVSHQTKAVDSAYSSVRKHDTRVINPATYAAPAVAYAQPAYAAPAVAYAHQPSVYSGVRAVAAPAVAAYHQPAVAAYHAPSVYANAPVAATTGLLGVRYSSFPQAAHYHFDSPVLGHYAY